MSVMKSRKGRLVAVRKHTEPVRKDNTVVGMRTWVGATIEITTDGPDKTRLVHVDMDPEEALTWSQKLIDVAGEVQHMREDVPHYEEPGEQGS